jgi:hypothetical protein
VAITRRVVLLTALAFGLAAALLAAQAPTAHADKYGFSCFVPANGFCTVSSPYRHIYKVHVWYPGTDGEKVIAGGLEESGAGVWGQARNRSNNGSFVTLDTGCGACWFHAVVYNYENNAHTIKGEYYFNP